MNRAAIGAQTDESSDAPDGEPLAADRPEPLALDVNVSEETPADREEGEERLLARLHAHQVHLFQVAPHYRQRADKHGVLVEGLPGR